MKDSFLRKLIENKESLIHDKRWGFIELNSKNGNWDIIALTTKKVKKT